MNAALARRPVNSGRNRPTRPRRWAVAGAVTGLLGAWLWFLPASRLATWVADQSGQHLQLAQARGSLWNGSANLVLTGGIGSRDATALPGWVHWQIQPHWTGLQVSLSADCCTTQPLQMHLSWHLGGGRLRIDDNQSQWPAAWLTGLGTPWNTVEAKGQLALSSQGLSVEWADGRLAVSGQAQLLAQHISSRLSTLQPMGSYRITLTGGSVPSLALDTIEGSLQLKGAGHWVGSRLHFEGVASAAPDREAALANLLNIIGRRSGATSIISLG